MPQNILRCDNDNEIICHRYCSIYPYLYIIYVLLSIYFMVSPQLAWPCVGLYVHDNNNHKNKLKYPTSCNITKHVVMFRLFEIRILENPFWEQWTPLRSEKKLCFTTFKMNSYDMVLAESWSVKQSEHVRLRKQICRFKIDHLNAWFKINICFIYIVCYMSHNIITKKWPNC